MIESSVVDWNAIFMKGVKTRDDIQVGTVIGTSEADVLVERGSRTIYTIPKTNVAGFDGNEILLNLLDQELFAFESAV